MTQLTDEDRALIARLVKPYTAMHAMVVNYPEEIAALLSAARTQSQGDGSDMQEDGSEVWKWYAGRDDENYTTGPEDSREAIIALGCVDFDGEAFHIIEARKGSMKRWLPSGNDVTDQIFERASDDGAFGDDFGEPTGTPEQQKAADDDLDVVLSAWYERHKHIFPEPWEFAASRNGEWIHAAMTAATPTASQTEG